jgi:hypothetical protein
VSDAQVQQSFIRYSLPTNELTLFSLFVWERCVLGGIFAALS